MIEFLYLLPIILESIDSFKFSFQPDFSPISIGVLIIWIYGFIYFKKSFIQNRLATSFFIILFGLFLSGMLAENPANELTRTIAFLIGILASVGFAKFLFFKNYIDKLYLFFLAMNFYWLYYVFELYLTGKITGEFHFNSFNQTVETVNSHTVSIALSVSSIYLFNFFLSKEGFKNKLFAFAIFGASIFAMMVAQSRSNVSFTLLITSIILLLKYTKKVGPTQLALSLGLFFLLASYVPKIASNFGDSDSSIAKRFNLEDDEYQTSTTNSRKLVYIAFYSRLSDNFFGTGIIRPKLYIGTNEITNLLMHNQYATWALAGGWISLFGVIMLIISIIAFFVKFLNLYRTLDSNIISLNLAILVYLITLLTIEQSGIIFFVFSGLLIYQQAVYFKNK